MSDSYNSEIEVTGDVDLGLGNFESSINSLDNKLQSLDERFKSVLKSIALLNEQKLLKDADVSGINKQIEKLSAELVSIRKEFNDTAFIRGEATPPSNKKTSFWQGDKGKGYKAGQKEINRRQKEIDDVLKAIEKQKEKAEIAAYQAETASGKNRRNSAIEGEKLYAKLNNGSLDFNNVKINPRNLVDMNNYFTEQKKILKQIEEIDELKKSLNLKNIDKNTLSDKGKMGLDLINKGLDPYLALSRTQMSAIRQIPKDYNKYQEQLKVDELRINASNITFEKAMTLDPNSEQAKNLFSLGETLVNKNGGKPMTFGLAGNELKQSLREQEIAIKYYNERKIQAEKEAFEKEYQAYKHEIYINSEKKEKIRQDYMSEGFDINKVDPKKARLIREMQANPVFWFYDEQQEKLKNQQKNAETARLRYELSREKEDRRNREKAEEDERREKRGQKTQNHRILSEAGQLGSIISNIDDPSGISKLAGGTTNTITSVAMGAMYGGAWGAALSGVNQLTKGLTELYNSSLMAYKGVEKLKVNLSVISGSDAQGNALFNEIAQYAIKSPFGVETTAEQATLLKQSGVYQDELMDTLKRMGDLAGGNAEKMRRISNDYAMIVANGKANMVQLRQLANAGVPIYKEIAKEMGVTISEVRKLSKQGEITADVVKKVITNMTSEGGTFFNAVEKGSKTVAARTVNLEDIKNLAKSEIGSIFQNGFGNSLGDDGSLRNSLLGFTENFWQSLYDWGRDFNIGRKQDNLEKNRKALIKAEEKYQKAVESGDDLSVYYWSKEKEKFANAIGSDYKDSVYSEVSVYRKELEEEVEKLENELLEYRGDITLRNSFDKSKRTVSWGEFLEEKLTPMKYGQKTDFYNYFAGSTKGTGLIKKAQKLAVLYENLNKLGDISFDERIAEFSNNMADTFVSAEGNFEKARNATDSVAQYALDMSNKFKSTSTYKLGNDYDEYLKISNAQTQARNFQDFLGGKSLPSAISEKMMEGYDKGSLIDKVLSYSDISAGRAFDAKSDTRDVDTETFKIQARNYGILVEEMLDGLDLTKTNSSLSKYVKNLRRMVTSQGFVDNNFNEQFLTEINTESNFYNNLKKNSNKLSKEEKKVFDTISRFRSILLTLDSEANFDILDTDINLTNHRRRPVNAFSKSNESTRDALTRYYLGYSSNGYGGVSLPREREDARQQLLNMQRFSNVDLFSRPKVSAEKMRAAGWTDVTEGYATVYSSSYDNGKGGYVTVTPILPDGKVLTPAQLDDYVTGLFAGKKDRKELVLGVHTSQEDANAFGEALHVAQEKYYSDPRDVMLEFARDIQDTSSTLYLYQGALDESIKALENEKSTIVTIQTLLEKGSLDDVIKAVSESDQVTQDTFKESLVIKRNGAERNLENEEMSFENGRLYVREGKKWIDALNDNRYEVSTNNLINALDKNRASLDSLSTLYKIDSLGNKTLNNVRKDVVSLNFSKMLKDTNWLSNEGLKTPKYEKDGKTLTKDYEYAVNTFTGMVNEMYGYLLPVVDDRSQDALDKFNKKYHKDYSFEQVDNIKNELDYIRWGEGDGTYDNSKMQSGFKNIFGEWFQRIINELNGYANATDDDLTKGLQPLWKRIIESNLGLDPTMFTNGGEVMRVHENEQYRRNLTKDFMSTAARQGYSTNLITGMLSYRSGVTKNDLDGQVNKQIDWKATTENIKKFALNVGQAAEITSAYRQSVEDEVNTLSDLLANMPTTPEDFANATSFKDSFWNAFTGELKMGDQTVKYDAQTGLVTAANGVIYALADVKDQLSYSEHTMEELEKQLEQRHEDLREARRAEIRNTAYQEGNKSYTEREIEFLLENRYGFRPGTASFENAKSQAMYRFDNNNVYTQDYLKSKEYEKGLEDAQAEDKKANEKIIKENDAKIEAQQSIVDNAKKSIEDAKKIRSEVISESIVSWYNYLKDKEQTDKEYESWYNEDYKNIYRQRTAENSSKYDEYQDYLNINTNLGARQDKADEAVAAAKDELSTQEKILEELKNATVILSTTNASKYKEDISTKIAKGQIVESPDLLITNTNTRIAALDNLSGNQYAQSRRDAYKDLASQIIFGDDEFSSLKTVGRNWWNDRRDIARYGAPQDQLDYVNMFTDEKLQRLLANDLVSAQKELNTISDGLGNRALSAWTNANGDREALAKSEDWKAITDETTKATYQLMSYRKEMDGLRDSLTSTFDNFVLGQIKNSMESIGAGLREWAEETSETGQAWKDFGKNFVNATKSMTEQMGSLMVSAGLKMLIDGDKSMGIALLLAGGMNQIVSGFLKPDDDKEIDRKIETLKALKSDLKELIAQAKADAIYYEKEVSHKKALTTSQNMTNVNDAIITPSGNVINTHPDDWLIATKTPQTLGNNKSSAPVVNLNIVNNSGQQLSVKKTQTTSNGEINIEAIIEGVVGKGIAEGKFDNALNTRDMRSAGRNVYM